MSDSQPAASPFRRLAALVLLVVAGTAAAVIVGHEALGEAAPSAPSASSPVAAAPLERHTGRRPHPDTPRDPGGSVGAVRAVAVAEGRVPDGVTVFDDRYPAVTRLAPAFLAALRAAATDAAEDGVTFDVNSGWRSAAYQEELFREAVARYGSEREAARWVARPGTSVHESGAAVDVGDRAAAWLSEHGGGYGLCRVYDNEPWHYELRPDAPDDGCPARYADPTQDPRMQQ